ncbi:unnamed protein product [Pieris macdunnoughi]|uniref:Fibronectin type-III domain-containing protein n=1 Tax=Pieris macdunnoughi TaxID=345717 RepID=A0A821VNK2_9NEOP|nr:unnamed protein product [Pieris macdunnoughi]
MAAFTLYRHGRVDERQLHVLGPQHFWLGGGDLPRGVPSAPAPPALSLLHADHTEAQLAWRTAHHATAPPHGFTISWIRLREDNIESEQSRSDIEERTIEMGGEASGVVLRSLSCGATYSVRAVAHSRAGSSSPSAPLLVRTKPPVLVWEGGGSSEESREGGGSGSWRIASAASPAPWADADLTALHHRREVVIGELSASTWYTLRLWTTTDTARHQALLYAATTTHSGERLRRPTSFYSEGNAGRPSPGSEQTERVLGAVSLAFAALAALAVTTLLLVLLARRSSLWSCGVGGRREEGRRCSHSGASTDKSVCVEQQNLRNCQHDYKHDKLSPASDVYEISPYATFAVGGEAAEHTLQFRTFGLRDNDAPPHRVCRHHQHGHRQRSDDKHHSDCELQQLSRYEKVRPRPCAATSYCVPLGHHGGGGGGSGGGLSEVYAGDSSVESGPGSLSPRTHHDHS